MTGFAIATIIISLLTYLTVAGLLYFSGRKKVVELWEWLQSWIRGWNRDERKENVKGLKEEDKELVFVEGEKEKERGWGWGL
jgi:hypothetical protein